MRFEGKNQNAMHDCHLRAAGYVEGGYFFKKYGQKNCIC